MKMISSEKNDVVSITFFYLQLNILFLKCIAKYLQDTI